MDIVYEAIKRIPGITTDEAHEVATQLKSREDLATKADLLELKTELISEMYRLHNRMIMWLVVVGLAVVGIIKYL